MLCLFINILFNEFSVFKWNLEEYLQGIFSLIFSGITLILSLIIISKYLKYRKPELILVGITFIGLALPWLPIAISFLMVIIVNTPLSEQIFFIINLGFVSFTAVCWVLSIAKFMNVKIQNQKLIAIFGLTVALIFEIFFLILVFTDTSYIGTFTGTFRIEFPPIFSIHILIILVIFVILSLWFTGKALKSDNPEINLKGRFLLIAFISIIFGTVIEAAIPVLIINVIGRIVLISSSIEFYPDRSRKHLLFRKVMN